LRPRRGAKKPQPQWTTDDSDSDVDIDDPKDKDYGEPARKKPKKGPGKLSGRGSPQAAPQKKRSRSSAEPDIVEDDASDAQDTLPKKRSRSAELAVEEDHDAQHTISKKRARLENDKKDNNAPKFKPKRKRRNATPEEDAPEEGEDDAGERVTTKKVRITNADDKEDSDSGWETEPEEPVGDGENVAGHTLRTGFVGSLKEWRRIWSTLPLGIDGRVFCVMPS